MEIHKTEKWGTKLTIKFLKKYREHRCLWDFNDPKYKNRVARTKALQDIVTCMALNNFDVRSANVKIKALRSTYLHEKRKIRKSSIVGIGSIYRPKLAWYPLADSFLKNYVMEKFCLMGTVPQEDVAQTQSTQPKDPDISNLGPSDHCKPKILIDRQQSVSTSLPQQNLSSTNPSNQKFNPRSSPNTDLTRSSQMHSSISAHQQTMTTSATNFQSNKREENPTTNQMLRLTAVPSLGVIMENCRPNAVNANSNTLAHHKDYDEFDAFANSIAAQLKTLPLDVAYEIQLQIQCLITQTKLKVLGRQTSIIVESNANNLTSNNNWNPSNHHNSNVNENYLNTCNAEVKVEKNDIEQNNQNSEMTNSNNCYTDGLQNPPETSDVEDYLGLE